MNNSWEFPASVTRLKMGSPSEPERTVQRPTSAHVGTRADTMQPAPYPRIYAYAVPTSTTSPRVDASTLPPLRQSAVLPGVTAV